MKKKDLFFLRCWIVLIIVVTILQQLINLTDGSETAPFFSHPYLAVWDIFLAVFYTVFVISGATIFWRLLNERTKDTKHTDG